MWRLHMHSTGAAIVFAAQTWLANGAASRPDAVLPKVQYREASDGAMGLFSSADHEAGAVVESCYAVPVEYSTLGSLVAQWVYVPRRADDSTYPEGMALVPWGWCLLYNQAPVADGMEPNLDWSWEAKIDGGGHPRYFISLVARRPLKVGEELFFRRQHNVTDVTGLRDMASIVLQDSLRRANMTLAEENHAVDSSSDKAVVGPALDAPLPSDIEMRFSPLHGCGIFAVRDFAQGEILEVSPTLNIDTEQLKLGTLGDYYFQGFANNVVEVSLGLGSIYNHDSDPNVLYAHVLTRGAPGPLRYAQQHTAARDIVAGEELFISYGEHWWAGANRSMPEDRHADGKPWRVWRPTAAGREDTLGVFADHEYPKGHEVERCVMYMEPASGIPGDELRNALYSVDEAGADQSLIFPYGWCLLYNEVPGGPEAEPSLSWEITTSTDEHSGLTMQYLSLKTARDLKVGDEMTVRRRKYGTSAAEAAPVRDVIGAAIHRLGKHVTVPGLAASLTGTSRGRREIEGKSLPPPAPADMDIQPDPQNPGGYRLYARREFAQGDVIEISPGLIVHHSEMSNPMFALCYKTFTPDACLIMLGVGSLFGHEDKPSLTYHFITTEEAAPGQRFTCSFVAKRDIGKGEELSINYHGGDVPDDEDPSDTEL